MTKMIAPEGMTGIIQSRHGGVLHIIDGAVDVPNGADVIDLIRANFVVAPPPLAPTIDEQIAALEAEEAHQAQVSQHAADRLALLQEHVADLKAKRLSDPPEAIEPAKPTV